MILTRIKDAEDIDDEKLSHTRIELACAMEQRKPAAVFMERGQKQEQSLNAGAFSGVEFCEPENVKIWNTTEELGDAICRKINQLKKSRAMRGWKIGDEISKDSDAKNLRSEINTLESRIRELEARSTTSS